jgi:hypothetical protein
MADSADVLSDAACSEDGAAGLRPHATSTNEAATTKLLSIIDEPSCGRFERKHAAGQEVHFSGPLSLVPIWPNYDRRYLFSSFVAGAGSSGGCTEVATDVRSNRGGTLCRRPSSKPSPINRGSTP